jgi:hypothetical protein
MFESKEQRWLKPLDLLLGAALLSRRTAPLREKKGGCLGSKAADQQLKHSVRIDRVAESTGQIGRNKSEKEQVVVPD